ncbi:hypothetical protein TKK_0013720 [Trichogramma kaykai]
MTLIEEVSSVTQADMSTPFSDLKDTLSLLAAGMRDLKQAILERPLAAPVQSNEWSGNCDDRIDGLIRAVEGLTRVVSRGKSKPVAGNSNDLCYYHSRYADKALKCVKPCSWPESNDRKFNTDSKNL